MRIPETQIEAEVLVMPPKVSAIYFLIKQGEVVYVGKTTNIIARTWSHEHDKQFDQVLFIRCDPTELTNLEDHWLLTLRPPLNGDGAFVQAERRQKIRASYLHVD